MTQTVKYLSFRLFFSLLIFFPALYTYGAILYGDGSGTSVGDDRFFLLALFVCIVFLVSLSLSFIGRIVLRWRCDELTGRNADPAEICALFEKIGDLTRSSFFTSVTGERLRRELLGLFSDKAAESADDPFMRGILEAALLAGIGSEKITSSLVLAYSRLETLTDEELRCAEEIYRRDASNGTLFEKIVAEHLRRGLFGVASRVLYRDALKKGSPSSLSIARALRKRYLSGAAIDELGVWVLLVCLAVRGHFGENPALFKKSLLPPFKKFFGAKAILADEISRISSRLGEGAEALGEILAEEPAEIDFSIPSTPSQFEPIEIESEGEAVRGEEPVASKKSESKFFAKVAETGMSIVRSAGYVAAACAVTYLGYYMATFAHFGEVTEEKVATSQPPQGKEGDIPALSQAPAKEEVPKEDEKKAEENIVRSDKKYTIQILSGKNEQDARRTVLKLGGREKDAYLNVTGQKPEQWYRIRVGFFATQEEARSFGDKLVSSNQARGYFITEFGGGLWVSEKE